MQHLYIHKKSGGTYEVIYRALLEKDLSPYIVYKKPGDFLVWLRPEKEFWEKFERID